MKQIISLEDVMGIILLSLGNRVGKWRSELANRWS